MAKSVKPVNKPKRSIFLTVWLILMICFSALACLANAIAPSVLTEKIYPDALWYTLALLSVINILLAIALFFWQRWALYIVWTISIIIAVINVKYIHVSIFSALFGLLGPIILTWAMQKNWTDFR